MMDSAEKFGSKPSLLGKNDKIACVHCSSKNIVKRGKQKGKARQKQIYFCMDCRKRFVLYGLRRKSYSPKIILKAISYYNLGNTLEETSKLVNRRFKVKVSKSIVHSWLEEFRDFYPYHRIREKVLEGYGKEVITSRLFKHKGLTYNYRFHRPKLELFGYKHNGLENYLKAIGRDFPHSFFEQDDRCSQIKIDIDALKKEKNNYACRLARLALSAATNNKERHSLVEDFMLVNDTCTVATEVPVWFWEKKLNAGLGGTGICGHIDLLQVKWRELYILDFKPKAANENQQKVCSQLYLYALGLSFRTGIPLGKMRCAWFDSDVYFEFAPAKAKVNWDNCSLGSRATKEKAAKTENQKAPNAPKTGQKPCRKEWKSVERKKEAKVGVIEAKSLGR